MRQLGVTRTRALIRAKYGWPRRSVPFNRQAFHHPDGYRMDAAGYLSMCYGLPKYRGGANIVTLLTDGYMVEISLDDIQAGDALGYLGPDALDADGGLIVLFEKWLANDPSQRVALTWQHLPIIGLGPDLRAQPVNFKWHAYRFNHLLPEVQPTELVAA